MVVFDKGQRAAGDSAPSEGVMKNQQKKIETKTKKQTNGDGFKTLYVYER